MQIGTVKTGFIGQGEYDIADEIYHAGAMTPTPSLSKGLAAMLIEKSPLHAWNDCAQLNEPDPDDEEEEKAIWDLGKVFHKLILGKGADFDVFDFKDWRTKAAQEARANSYLQGRVPLLEKGMEAAEGMANAAKAQMRLHDDLAYAMSGGQAERSFVWEEQTPDGPIWCRCRPDWLPSAGPYQIDWKSTGVGAGPEDWGRRTMWDTACDMQAAFYARGVKAVTGRDLKMLFAVVETKPPYAMAVHEVDPPSLAVADRKVEYAIHAWARCLRYKRWPGYAPFTHYQEMPPWKAGRWLDREMNGSVDLEALDAQIQLLQSIRDGTKRQQGAEVTDDNPFGLS